MIVDSSALMAILKEEPGWETLSEVLDLAESSSISAANYFESGIIADKYRNAVLSRRLDELIDRFSIHVEPVTPQQARIARQAYRDYGRGSGHPANLNYGDCFSYALARDKREPLLYKGDDFGHTDLRSALDEK